MRGYLQLRHILWMTWAAMVLPRYCPEV